MNPRLSLLLSPFFHRRFTGAAEQEDLDVLFRVWAVKAYTKCVPLTVQVLQASALAKVAPFLDPTQVRPWVSVHGCCSAGAHEPCSILVMLGAEHVAITIPHTVLKHFCPCPPPIIEDTKDRKDIKVGRT